MAVRRLKALNGQGARAVLACVYGNRAYEDTLVELEDAARETGFRVIAAMAAVAEHSIARQFASGRPDEQDAQQIAAFAEQIRGKLSTNDLSEPKLPGNRPYKKSRRCQHSAQSYQGLQPLRCLCCKLPGRGYP